MFTTCKVQSYVTCLLNWSLVEWFPGFPPSPFLPPSPPPPPPPHSLLTSPKTHLIVLCVTLNHRKNTDTPIHRNDAVTMVMKMGNDTEINLYSKMLWSRGGEPPINVMHTWLWYVEWRHAWQRWTAGGGHGTPVRTLYTILARSPKVATATWHILPGAPEHVGPEVDA